MTLTAFISARPLPAQTAEINPLQLAPNHATISVADMEKEAKFFEQVLGFRVLQRAQNGAMTQLVIPSAASRQPGQGFRIDLIKQSGSSRPAETGLLRQGWFHVVFETPIIEADLKHLVDMGTDVKVNRNAKGVMSRLTFQDPEGNEIEIVDPLVANPLQPAK